MKPKLMLKLCDHRAKYLNTEVIIKQRKLIKKVVKNKESFIVSICILLYVWLEVEKNIEFRILRNLVLIFVYLLCSFVLSSCNDGYAPD